MPRLASAVGTNSAATTAPSLNSGTASAAKLSIAGSGGIDGGNRRDRRRWAASRTRPT